MFILSFPFVAFFMFLLHGLLDIYLRDPFLKYVRNYRMIEGILIGLKPLLSLKNILMVMMGCFFGTIIGMFLARTNDSNSFNDTNYLWI